MEVTISIMHVSLNISANKRCIVAKGLDDFEEKDTFTKKVGTDKDFSYKGKDVIAFSCVPY